MSGREGPRAYSLPSARRLSDWQATPNTASAVGRCGPRCPQGNAERRFQRVIEHRIARAVSEIGENDGVLLG